MPSLWTDRHPGPVPTDVTLPERVDVLVVGAGLTGLTTATLLAGQGKRVAVIEARRIGAVTTGHTTAKISLLQATKLSRIRARHPDRVVERYVDVSRRAMDWLLQFCADSGVRVQRRDAVTYASAPDQVDAARQEYDAARAAGLGVGWSDRVDAPFAVHGAVRLPDQAQCDPVELLDALATAVRGAGSTVHENSRLVSVSFGGAPEARLEDGSVVRAGHVVLATGTPVLDRGLHFARLTAQRSYLLSYAGVDPVEAMMISAGSPTRSVRDTPDDGDGVRLLVGGAGHRVGDSSSEVARLDDLRAWTADHFPGAVEHRAWSAQDYSPADELPIAGSLPIGGSRIQVATGYDKWGMTSGVAAAQRISADILGRSADWPRAARLSPKGLLRALGMNLETGGLLVTGWAGAELRTEGSDVHREGLVPTATSPEGPDLVGVCTHLGGVLRWNDAERSWDCPLHGSRFGCDGAVLEGPATRPLRRR